MDRECSDLKDQEGLSDMEQEEKSYTSAVAHQPVSHENMYVQSVLAIRNELVSTESFL